MWHPVQHPLVQDAHTDSSILHENTRQNPAKRRMRPPHRMGVTAHPEARVLNAKNSGLVVTNRRVPKVEDGDSKDIREEVFEEQKA